MEEKSRTKSGGDMMQEADLGSGEKSPGQQDTEKMIDSVGEARRKAGIDPLAQTSDKPEIKKGD